MARSIVVVVVVVLAGAAAGESDRALAERLARTAHQAAARMDCAAARVLLGRVRKLDEDVYREVTESDRVVLSCTGLAPPKAPAPPAPPADRARAEELTRTAREAAVAGDCATAQALRVQVQQADAAYYEAVFARDDDLNECAARLAPPTPPAPAPEPARPATVDPLGAAVVSAGGALLSFGLAGAIARASDSKVAVGVVTALVVAGPSAGHWFARDWVSGGMVLRAVTIGGAAVYLATADRNGGDELTLATVIGLGVVAGTVIDIATAPGAARRYNATLAPTSGGGGAIVLTGSF